MFISRYGNALRLPDNPPHCCLKGNLPRDLRLIKKNEYPEFVYLK